MYSMSNSQLICHKIFKEVIVAFVELSNMVLLSYAKNGDFYKQIFSSVSSFKAQHFCFLLFNKYFTHNINYLKCFLS